MGGIYYNQWSCSNCDFEDRTVSGPFIVDAKSGVYNALIEQRFCNECNGIRRCFTGKAATYQLSDVEARNNDIIYQWSFKKRDEINSRINDLEMKKKTSLLFSFSKKAKELSLLKQALNNCDELSAKAKLFYDELNPQPRCLICGTNNISQLDWSFDKHSCGGDFIKNNSGRMGTVGSYDIIVYDENGNPNHSIKSMC